MATFIIDEFQERPIPEGRQRLVDLPQAPNKAAVIIGMRRAGKTYLMYQAMRRLIAAGTSKNDILYVNFEDDRLDLQQPSMLNDVLEAFYRRNPEARTRGAHLFLDEIQMAPGWPRFVRRVLDTENASVVLSGSSAKLLHTEVATELRGRGLTCEVFPYSFAESAMGPAEASSPVADVGPRARSRLEAHLERYLDVGGFPEVRDMEPGDRLQTLQDYVEVVLVRDVIERHGVTNIAAVRAFARTLLQSPASLFSVNRVYNDLRSRGLSVSKDLLHATLDYFQDAYLVFAVPVFHRSQRVRAANPRKLYAIDPGLGSAMSHITATDVGARLENAVFLELRRRHGRLLQGEVAYYVTGSGYEVDFVVGDVFEQRVVSLTQVCSSLMEPATRARELRALTQAMAETGVRSAEIVTLHEKETIATDAGTIDVVPAWRWLLQRSG